MSSPRELHRATLLPNGSVLVAGGDDSVKALASADLFFPFGALQQLPAHSCSLKGHIKSLNSNTPTAVRFVNTSATATFQVFWLDFSGNRVHYNTLGPGQSYVQLTFLTHPWVIADTSTSPNPLGQCQEIYLPVQEQAPAIFPPSVIIF